MTRAVLVYQAAQILNGQKAWMTNGGFAGLYTVDRQDRVTDLDVGEAGDHEEISGSSFPHIDPLQSDEAQQRGEAEKLGHRLRAHQVLDHARVLPRDRGG